jgi:hypothetical protein
MKKFTASDAAELARRRYGGELFTVNTGEYFSAPSLALLINDALEEYRLALDEIANGAKEVDSEVAISPWHEYSADQLRAIARNALEKPTAPEPPPGPPLREIKEGVSIDTSQRRTFWRVIAGLWIAGGAMLYSLYRYLFKGKGNGKSD